MPSPQYGTGAVGASSGGKTLAQLQTICQYHGWQDNTTDGLAALTQFINDTLQILATLAEWPEYQHRDGQVIFAAGDSADDDVVLANTRLDRVGVLIRDDRVSPLDEITVEEWLYEKKYHASSGPPTHYALRKYLTSGAPTVEMLCYPSPTTAITLYYTWRNYPGILASAEDVAEWPDTRVWLLTDALRIRLAAADRDSGGVALYGAEFMKNVHRAFGHSRSSYMPIIAKPTYGYNGKPIWKLRQIEKTFV